MVKAQQTYNLQTCLNQALQNNHNLKKSRFDREKSDEARKEILGALFPQVSGSANLTGNIKKSKFIMPNFINEFMPSNMQDPNASKYMTIEMGTNYSAGLGVALNQQILNMSLFNAVNIAETVQNMAALGVESKEEDIITQTANVYYAIQVTNYAVGQMDKSVDLLDKMIETMIVSYANGLVRKVDLDRIKVTKINLETQKSSIQNVVEVQKNLLKLQMGLEMNQPIEIEPVDLAFFENKSIQLGGYEFDINLQTPYKLMMQQKNIGDLQKKSALYESLPVLVFNVNYNYNGVSDQFFSGETNYWYPSSMAILSLKVPIFGGLSRTAKLKQAAFEQKKIQEDVSTLEQSLNMAYLNARMKLEDNRKTILSQKDNMALAQDVYNVTEMNFRQGVSSMSDVLNANSSLIQAQVNYADALNNYMKAYIDLRKANGTIRGLVEKQ
jgi:outer membrane protein TolC